jgi:hypothetical protein
LPKPTGAYQTVGDVLDDLIEHIDEINGVAFPLHWTAGQTVWAHSAADIRVWLQEFANSRDLWHAPLAKSEEGAS